MVVLIVMVVLMLCPMRKMLAVMVLRSLLVKLKLSPMSVLAKLIGNALTDNKVDITHCQR